MQRCYNNFSRLALRNSSGNMSSHYLGGEAMMADKAVVPGLKAVCYVPVLKFAAYR